MAHQTGRVQDLIPGSRIEMLRKNTFFALSSFGLVVVLIAETVDWPDIGLLHYGISSVFAWTCAAFFSDWWRYKGSATAIYAWITFLLYAIAANDTLQFIARWLLVYRTEHYQWFITSWFWEYRSAPKILCLIYLVSFTVWQRYKEEN